MKMRWQTILGGIDKQMEMSNTTCNMQKPGSSILCEIIAVLVTTMFLDQAAIMFACGHF